ncbi:MAG: GDP-mannose 4,6-dehydratase [Actinomycetota bacterium]
MSAIRGSRILITGGAGFIGSHLVDTLLRRGAGHVRVLDNLSNGNRANLDHLANEARFELLLGDIRSDDARSAAIAGVDIVYHLACLGVRHSLHDPIENHRVNAEGTLRMLQAALEQKTGMFVYVSTSEVFGTAQYAPMDERHPTWPETVYGGGKLAGEAYTRAYFRTHGLPTAVVRPFNTYGPRSHFEGDSGEVLPRTIVRLLAGLRPVVFGDGEQTRDFMHVSDTATALALVGDTDGIAGQTINLGSGSETSINELCAAVAIAVGRPDLTPEHLEARPGDVRRLLGDPSVMNSLTGFVPLVGFRDGVADLVEWFRAGGRDIPEMLSRIEVRNWLPETVR